MEPLLSSDQSRQVDHHTIYTLGIAEAILMEHAALAVVGALEKRFHHCLNQTSGILLIGPGKNGADALVVARLLIQKGCKQLFLVAPQITEHHESQLRVLGQLGVQTHRTLPDGVLESAQWVVDGLFGIGLSRPLEEPYSSLVEKVNATKDRIWKIAIDIPSGLNSNTGQPFGSCFIADETIALGFIKKGLVTGQAANFTGRVELASIQIPRELQFPVDEFWYRKEDISQLPHRNKTAHKGQFGHVHIVLGEPGKQGAALIAAWGALRAGAGLVSIAGTPQQLVEARARFPLEVMTEEISDQAFKNPSEQVWVLGPGLGLDQSVLLEMALKSVHRLILDADALTLLASHASLVDLLVKRKNTPTVLTPHPKEASKLLGCTVNEVESDRYQAVKELEKKFQCFCILKGKGNCIRAPQGPTFVMTPGDSGLSKGGTGDLLSGILGALLAQSISTLHGVLLSVYLHGRASELLTQKYGTERASIASEIAQEIITAWREIEK